MPLNLDARQRAMLQEMGITVWMPRPVAAPQPAVAMAPPVTTTAPAVPQAAAAVLERPAAPPAAPVSAPAAPAKAPAPAAPVPAAATLPAVAWEMAPAVQLYPQATGGRAGDGWLVIAECPTPHAPLSGDWGKLLDNMLRALRLHHHSQVWLAALRRPGSEALPTAGVLPAPVAWQPLDSTLATTMGHTQPARVVVLGLHAARAVLGSNAPLGQLRAQIHHVAGVPAVVTYDPGFLMRTPHNKAATWADLCRAHALQPPAA